MFSPTQKKVAFALCSFKVERTHGVISGMGPSSNVRNIFFCLVGIRQIADEKIFLISKFGRTKYIEKLFSPHPAWLLILRRCGKTFILLELAFQFFCKVICIETMRIRDQLLHHFYAFLQIGLMCT